MIAKDDSLKWSSRVFTLAWLFIMAVSIYDACLLFRLRDVIAQTEQNPVGVWLIATFGSVWMFIFLKILGTIVVCTILRILYQHYHAIGLVVTLVLALLQSLLLIYLTI